MGKLSNKPGRTNLSIKLSGISKVRKQRSSLFGPGTHGFRKKEQSRLGELGQRVTGDTHESEHLYGFAVLNKSSKLSRKQSSELEKSAPAYQEVKEMHRLHVGTGSSKKLTSSGMSSETYRSETRALLSEGNTSAAGQLNSLGYAFVDGFSKKSKSLRGRQSWNSFVNMVKNMKSIPMMKRGKMTSNVIDDEDRLEILTSRWTAENQKWPNEDEINSLKDLLAD